MHNPSSDMYMYSFRDLLILPGITFELVRLLSTFIALRVVAVLGSAVCQSSATVATAASSKQETCRERFSTHEATKALFQPAHRSSTSSQHRRCAVDPKQLDPAACGSEKNLNHQDSVDSRRISYFTQRSTTSRPHELAWSCM